jgi:hypothetical protein
MMMTIIFITPLLLKEAKQKEENIYFNVLQFDAEQLLLPNDSSS